MTLYETIQKNAQENPTDIAVKYFGTEWTYSRLVLEADRVAGSLKRLGVEKGDRIGVCLPNCPDMLSVFYGINKLGAVAVMFNPKSPADEMERQLRMTDCKGMFFSRIAMNSIMGMKNVDDNMFMICVPILPYMPIHIKIAIMSRLAKQKSMGAFLKKYKNGYSYSSFLKKSMLANKNNDDKCDAVVIFSGGTNGTFKAVVHSSVSFEESAVNCLETEKPLPKPLSMMAVLPAFHIFGLTVAIHLPLYAGGYVVLVPVFNLGIMTNIIKKECPVFFPGVPTIFERLLKYPKFVKLASKGQLNFSKFKHGFVGGDNLTDTVRDEFNEMIRKNGGNGYISMGYGMSECCPICVNNRESGSPESIGILFDDMQIKILDENDDVELAEEEVGEITIASKHMMSYGFDEEGNRTEPYLDDNGVCWLRTGDLGYLKDSKVHYKCRQRRIIKVSGNTVFASSIEKILLENMENVKGVYVVPIAHESRGYGAFAFVNTNNEIKDDELLRIVRNVCKNRMIPYAIPVGAAYISESEIPYTPIGKVSWGKLEKKAQEIMH